MLHRFSCVRLFATLWTVTLQAPLSMGFSRQKYWSGSPLPPPEDLPGPGIEPVSLCLLHWQVGSLPLVPSLAETRFGVVYHKAVVTEYTLLTTIQPTVGS